MWNIKRGYLGPIGDDFPAIFPIALGLMLFFGTITLTYNLYSYKQETTTLMRANIALSKAVRGQLEFDHDYFFGERGRGGVCEVLEKTKTNYGVQAKMELMNFWYDNRKFNSQVERLSGKQAECGDLGDTLNPLPPPNKQSVRMVYPVVVRIQRLGDMPEETVPRSLVVTTWM